MVSLLNRLEKQMKDLEKNKRSFFSPIRYTRVNDNQIKIRKKKNSLVNKI